MPGVRPRLRLVASAALMAGWVAALAFVVAAPALAQAPSGEPKPAPAMPEPKSSTSSQPAMPQPGDAFGEEVTLPDRTIVYLKGHTNWDTAFDTLIDAFKSLNDYLAKQNIKPAGPYLTIYTETDDTGFSFQAAATITQPPANPPKGDIATDKGPTGKALKFVHRGSYDSMDATYEAITNYLDDRQLEAKDSFIEEYASDPVKSDPNNLVVNIYVPVK